MRQYSDDLRSKLIHAWQDWDGSQQELADWWGVSRSWLQKVIRRWRETGQAAAARYRHGPVSRVNPQRLTALVEAHPEATLVELGRRLRVSAPTVCLWLQRLGLPRKKIIACQRAGHPARPGVAGSLATDLPSLGCAKACLCR